MNEYPKQDSTMQRTPFRLETGLDVFEDWAATAPEAQRAAIHKALFAMVDGTLFRTYRVVDDYQRPNELFVIVTDDLVMKVRVNCFDSFGIVHIGPPADVARRGRTQGMRG